MARPIVIEFAANVRDFLRGTRDVERATEDIADELQSATKASDRFEREFEQSMRDAERAAGRTSRGVEKDFDRMGDEMGEVGDEAGQEFKQNLSESLSSGDIDSLVQDTLGGVISGLSGAAAGAAAAVAGVAALVFNEMQEQAEKAAELATNTVAAIDGLYDVIDQRWTQAKANQQVQQFLEDNKQLLAEMEPFVRNIGIDFDEWVVQLSGATGQHKQALAILDQIVAQEQQRARELGLQQGEWTKTAQDALYVRDMIKGTVKDVSDWQYEQGLVNSSYSRYLQMSGQAAANWQETRNYARAAREEIENMPTRVQVALDFYATGPGAAYINPNSASYSPGHVAISNMYVREARGGVAR